MSTFVTFVFLFFFLCKTGAKKDQQKKRLLLNDPDVVADRLGRLERLVNKLEGTVSRLTINQSK